jgi:hypothetical protein
MAAEFLNDANDSICKNWINFSGQSLLSSTGG